MAEQGERAGLSPQSLMALCQHFGVEGLDPRSMHEVLRVSWANLHLQHQKIPQLAYCALILWLPVFCPAESKQVVEVSNGCIQHVPGHT